MQSRNPRIDIDMNGPTYPIKSVEKADFKGFKIHMCSSCYNI